MIKINGNEGITILDLNLDREKDNYTFSIESLDKRGRWSNWGIDAVTCTDTVCEKDYDKLKVGVKRSSIKDYGYVLIQNGNRDTAAVKIIPDEEELREKTFDFSLSKPTIEGNIVTFTVKSKINGRPCDWEVTYDGKPILYNIKASKAKLSIEYIDSYDVDIGGLIALSQHKSGKVIEIHLLHKTSGETEIIDIKKG